MNGVCQLIRELRYLEEKHKNDKVPFCATDWSKVCHEVADKLQALDTELHKLKHMHDCFNCCHCHSNSEGKAECECAKWKSDKEHRNTKVTKSGMLMTVDELIYELQRTPKNFYIALRLDENSNTIYPISELKVDKVRKDFGYAVLALSKNGLEED